MDLCVMSNDADFKRRPIQCNRCLRPSENLALVKQVRCSKAQLIDSSVDCLDVLRFSSGHQRCLHVYRQQGVVLVFLKRPLFLRAEAPELVTRHPSQRQHQPALSCRVQPLALPLLPS